ncbi:hypothetical protein ABE29_17885 [Cytobacillus firmus]|uniref:Uncharacterized protein n=1 Tax=Cytobacillus firmus TaxID=1399 RepID=A0A380XWE2_CYTFI|nr:hypothetical protein KIS1582_0102 [Cytobacillus firmus]MBG9544575.1 hypothetical protein [Cytobacillus firmus]MBG9546525.1 hypothetical protein [Cytobacillus firmus]MBG9553002.1 hypothetical protein [Cytobacillus firmus]MBG9555286.1 hypothetical protein [Cytobacillus firmus]
MTPAGGEGAGDPAGEAEEAPVPPRGKQVPAAEINEHNSQQKNTFEKWTFNIKVVMTPGTQIKYNSSRNYFLV